MEKLAKYYLFVEGIILAMIFLSGFYDPSFWLFGIIFVGIIASLIGSIISWVWCKSRLRANGPVTRPYAFAVGNAVLFVCMIVFILAIFSGGVRFLM